MLFASCWSTIGVCDPMVGSTKPTMGVCDPMVGLTASCQQQAGNGGNGWHTPKKSQPILQRLQLLTLNRLASCWSTMGVCDPMVGPTTHIIASHRSTIGVCDPMVGLTSSLQLRNRTSSRRYCLQLNRFSKEWTGTLFYSHFLC